MVTKIKFHKKKVFFSFINKYYQVLIVIWSKIIEKHSSEKDLTLGITFSRILETGHICYMAPKKNDYLYYFLPHLIFVASDICGREHLE